MKKIYANPKMIAVDVDKTLYCLGELNSGLVEWLRDRAAAGFEIIVWSSRGTEYARMAAERAGIAGIITAAISKPGYIVDDVGWSWIKFTEALPLEQFTESG